MEAHESYNGYYAWPSILKGRDVLLKGAKWRVGTGDSISVWLDAWLPSRDHPRVLSPVVEGFEEAQVAEMEDKVIWPHHSLGTVYCAVGV